jgi:ATPase subunit of ABC transporter with duplicated ATPase domains
MFTVSGLTKRFGDRLILDQVSFALNAGEHIGLVGPNGAGKTTLLNIVSGLDIPDQGSVQIGPNDRVGFLRQGFAELPEGTLADLIDSQLDGLLAAHQALDLATARLGEESGEGPLAAYDEALATFDALGGYAAVDALDVIFGKLGVGGLAFSTPLRELSGGQKTRAGLGALLALKLSILLLDEPTNHLDIDALAWLEQFISTYRGAVLIVSHDRAFLDKVATGIFELDTTSHQLTAYAGNYSAYQASKQAESLARAQAYERQQRDIARIEQDIRSVAGHAQKTESATQDDFLRGRAKKVARTAKVRERKLERMLDSAERIDKPERSWGMALAFGNGAESSREVAVVDGASVELGGRAVLRDVDLHIRAGDRIAVTGPNGGGKSTLIRLLTGLVPPVEGSVKLGPSVVPGLYAQEQENVDPGLTVLEQARAVSPMSETEARKFLHLYLFGGDMVFRKAAELSYGERARLALALLVLKGANFLLLDEPLNHLDLPSRERFEEALLQFDGTLLIVLHDRYAIERLATRVIEIRDGQLKEL